ncbi:MAG: PD40 domain-containing protein [Thermomicrobiales bacterium]|nr:PD40 domain-containing protein [Thermomicrobiales bacterium]
MSNAEVARRKTRRAVVGAAPLVLALLATGCGTAGSAPGLYLADPSGAPRWITTAAGPPAWSPNGNTLAWGGEDGLWHWDADGDEVGQLSDIPVAGRPAWSPDGAAIAFLDPGARLLRSLDLESGVATPLALLYDGPDGAVRPPMVVRGGPVWSPDGSQLAFICWDGQGDELCLVDAAGDTRQQLTDLGGANADSSGAARSSVTSVAWSPDGRALAVTVWAEQRGAAAGIFRIDLDDRSGRRLTTMTADSPLLWDAVTDDLIFSSLADGRSDVYRLASDSGRPTAVTSFLPAGASDPALGSDQALAVVTGSRLAVLPSGDAAPTFVEIEGLALAAPDWRPGHAELAFLGTKQPIQDYP